MLKVLGRKTSSNVQKVLWACGELGLEFEREDIGGAFGGNDRPEYLAMNPNGLVPTLIEDGFVLWESNSIVRYLACTRDPGGLWPEDARVRAGAERWMDWQLTVMSPSMIPIFRGLVRTPPEKRDPEIVARARDGLSRSMAILDAALADNEFLAGPDFTMADIPVGIAAWRWYAMDIEREDYANLKRWFDLLSARPPYREHIMLPLE